MLPEAAAVGVLLAAAATYVLALDPRRVVVVRLHVVLQGQVAGKGLRWKLLSSNHCQELGQQASWLLISCTKVNNQS